MQAQYTTRATIRKARLGYDVIVVEIRRTSTGLRQIEDRGQRHFSNLDAAKYYAGRVEAGKAEVA